MNTVDRIKELGHRISVAPPERGDLQRYGAQLRIRLVGNNNFYFGMSENISEGGIFVATHHTLPIGSVLELQFRIPTTDQLLTVEGEVRWVRPANALAKETNDFGAEDNNRMRPGMGIQFKNLGAIARGAIEAFIEMRSPEFYDA
jgi:uncharacterized protein (TIGR02266 family)